MNLVEKKFYFSVKYRHQSLAQKLFEIYISFFLCMSVACFLQKKMRLLSFFFFFFFFFLTKIAGPGLSLSHAQMQGEGNRGQL